MCNFQSPINDFLRTKFDCISGDIDRALNNFNNINICCKSVAEKKTRKHKTNKLQQQNKKWYGPTLRQIKSDVRKLGRLLCSKPHATTKLEKIITEN